MAKELVARSKFYNLLCKCLGGQSDIVDQILLPFLEKNLKDYSDNYRAESFDLTSFRDCALFFKSWKSFMQNTHYFYDRKIHFYYEENSNFKMTDIDENINFDHNKYKRLPLLFLWTEKDNYSNRQYQSVVLMNESLEEEDEIIEFLNDHNSFAHELDLAF
jgi:hypothetical protein